MRRGRLTRHKLAGQFYCATDHAGGVGPDIGPLSPAARATHWVV